MTSHPDQRERMDALLSFGIALVMLYVAIHEALLWGPTMSAIEGAGILLSTSMAVVFLTRFGMTVGKLRSSRPETGSEDDMNELTHSTGGIADE